jgi:sugar (pentulose or hexulose) kinase
MLNEKLFLAIDAGTTMVKAVLTGVDGRFIDTAGVKLQILMPRPNWCEMDMDTVWQAVCEAICRVRENNASVWQNICAIGICGQGDGMWPVDKNGKPVRNAVLWNDTRASGLVDYDGISTTCISLGTSPLFPGAAPVILHWLKENEPENYGRIATVLHCKDWLNYNLTGKLVTDDTDASTALMNIYTKKYEYSLLEQLGIRESAEWFPPVTASDQIIGTVTEQAAGLLKIKPGTPVIAGAIDVLAAATGCGVTETSQKGSIIGTTLCNYVVLNEERAHTDAGNIGSVLCHTRPGTYIRLMAALSGASALDWVRREILADEPYAEFEPKIEKLPIGSEGVFFHPYLFGERAPFRIADASGGFYGLRAGHTKYHMARAAFEGVVLSLYDCYQNLPTGENGFVIAGGAAKSNLVCQMLCDCMGEKTVRYREKELGILGLVRLLQRATGLGIEGRDAEKDVFLPDMAKHEEYKKVYSQFCWLKEKMIPFWKRER